MPRADAPVQTRDDLWAALAKAMLHHATTVNIKGDSYRLREKKKAGTPGPQAQGGRAREGRRPGMTPTGTRTVGEQDGIGAIRVAR
jgi:hypothetical protein